MCSADILFTPLPSKLRRDLIALRELLATRGRWTQGQWQKGEAFCLVGGAKRVAALRHLDAGAAQRAMVDALREHLPASAENSVIQFNDALDTTHEAVLALIDRTIEATL